MEKIETNTWKMAKNWQKNDAKSKKMIKKNAENQERKKGKRMAKNSIVKCFFFHIFGEFYENGGNVVVHGCLKGVPDK